MEEDITAWSTPVETLQRPDSSTIIDTPPKTSWLRRRIPFGRKKVTVATDEPTEVEEVGEVGKEDELEQSIPPSIEIIAPTQNQIVLAGETLSIRWKSNFRGGFVRIELCQERVDDGEADGNADDEIVKEIVISGSTFNDGSFSWATKHHLYQTRYTISISNQDAKGISEVFSIARNKSDLKSLMGASSSGKEDSTRPADDHRRHSYDDEYEDYEEEINSVVYSGFVEQRKNLLSSLEDLERKSDWQTKHLWQSKWLEISSHYLFFYRDNTKTLPHHLLPSSMAILRANRAHSMNRIQRAFVVRKVDKLKKKEEICRLPLLAFDLCQVQARRHEDSDLNGLFYLDLPPEAGKSKGDCIKLRAGSGEDAITWLDEIEKVQEAYGVTNVVNKELLESTKSEVDDPHRVQSALDRLANANFKDNDGVGWTPLMHAAHNANIRQVKTLLAHDAGVNIKNHLGDTALNIVAATGAQRSKRALALRVASAVQSLAQGQVVPRKTKMLRMAVLLLDNSANVNMRNNSGNAPIHQAVIHNYLEMAQLLLLKHAKMNLTNNKGYTPLRCATQLWLMKMVKLLLENGAETKTADHAGTTPLIECCEDNNHRCVELLMRAGANPNIVSQASRSALMQASVHNHPKCARILLGYEQTQLDIQDSCGYTALMEASKNNHLTITRMLVRAGADVNVKSNPKRVALDYARQRIVEKGTWTSVRISHQLESTLVGCRVQMDDPLRMPYWGPSHRPTRGQATVVCMHKGWLPRQGWKTRHTLLFDNGFKKKVVLYDEASGGPWRNLTYDKMKGIEMEESTQPSEASTYDSYSDSSSDDSPSESEKDDSDDDSDTYSNSSDSTASTSSNGSSTRRRRGGRRAREPFAGYGRAKAFISPYCGQRVQRRGLLTIHVYKGSQLEAVHFAVHRAYVRIVDALYEPTARAATGLKGLKAKVKDKSKKYKQVGKGKGKDSDDEDDDNDDDDDNDNDDEVDDEDDDDGSSSTNSGSKPKSKKKEKNE